MNKLLFYFLCFYTYSVLANIKIKELKVPESIESGTVDDVILDCDFETDGDEKDIVIKWYFNGTHHPIYQWIPGLNNGPQAIGKLKDNIDVKYKINNDASTMHRALHIVNVTPDMSGNYTCRVSGLMSEDVGTKGMIIYEPADEGLDLSIFEEMSEIVCEAEGIYPEPKMKIYIINSNGTKIQSSNDGVENIQFDNNLYNISTSLIFDPENISNPFDYVCELTIPGTSYNLSKKRTHYLEPIETQIEEDYVNTTSSELPCNSTTEADCESAFDLLNSTQLVFDKSEGSSAIGHLPNHCLLSTVLLLVLSTISRS